MCLVNKWPWPGANFIAQFALVSGNSIWWAGVWGKAGRAGKANWARFGQDGRRVGALRRPLHV